MSLQIRHHFADVQHIALVYDGLVTQVAFALGRFVLEQVVFEGFAAHHFLAASRQFEPLCCCFASFEFGHGRTNFDTASYHIAIERIRAIDRSLKIKLPIHSIATLPTALKTV